MKFLEANEGSLFWSQIRDGGGEGGGGRGEDGMEKQSVRYNVTYSAGLYIP